MKKNDDFDLINLPEAARDPEIKAEDFTLQQADKEIHEQKFQTKPTTFLKDSLKRFRKNKSSVVATYILGLLISISIVTIIVNKATGYDVTNGDAQYAYLEPRLFKGGTGFWDGTVKKEHIAVDTSKSDDPSEWRPNPEYYYEDGIGDDFKVTGYEYTDEVSSYGKGGYVEVGYYASYGITYARIDSYPMTSVDRDIPLDKEDVYYSDDDKFTVLDLNKDSIYITKFNTVDEQKFKDYHNAEKVVENLPDHIIPENFVLGDAYLTFNYLDKSSKEGDYITIPLTSKQTVHNVGTTLPGYPGSSPIDIVEIIKKETTQRVFRDFYFSISVDKPADLEEDISVCTLVKDLKFTVSSANKNVTGYFDGYIAEHKAGSTVLTEYIPGISYESAMEFIARKTKIPSSDYNFTNTGYWTIPSEFEVHKYVKNIHSGICAFADFTYDSYQGTYGRRENVIVTELQFEYYAEQGWIDYNIEQGPDGIHPIKSTFYFEILNEEECPIIEDVKYEDVIFKRSSGDFTASCTVMYYRYLGETSMPLFLFGTDKTGVSMFRYVFEGLFYSLALGVITFIICFLFGLLWGAVSGYFGGAVDLVMERVTDILAGIPWIVLMTIIVLKWNSNLLTFAIALCLTGWIGTAATTRTQFYRFRGREYVLASRTLGASDARLITKHILPNAMGTIITGAVLMIPSVIFSEATIAYLGLGFKNLASLGVILSNNQSELLTHPYLLIFPSVVIALIMISFNLFGNGLRDAINPSLKGEEQ